MKIKKKIYIKKDIPLTPEEENENFLKENALAINAMAKHEALTVKEITRRRDRYLRKWQLLERKNKIVTQETLKNKYDTIPSMILTALLSDEVKAQQKFINWAKKDFKGFIRDVLKYLPVTKVFEGKIQKTEEKIISFSEGLSEIEENLKSDPDIIKQIEMEIIDQ